MNSQVCHFCGEEFKQEDHPTLLDAALKHTVLCMSTLSDKSKRSGKHVPIRHSDSGLSINFVDHHEIPADADALAHLLDGYHRFRSTGWLRQRARWKHLANGQAPRIMIIACSDSRVDPGRIFDVSPGEIFVVRNVANLVPPYEVDASRHGVSAALEYAVTQLKVTDIVVMGHEYCGGCAAAMTRAFADAPNGSGGFIRHWVDMLYDASERITAKHGKGDDAMRALEHEAVRVSLANLRTFDFVKDAESAGRLRLTGGWFAIRDGCLSILNEETGEFSSA